MVKLKLIVVQGKSSKQTFHFGPGEYYIGKGPECQIRCDCEWISRQHCLFIVTPFQVTLRDLGSSTGTLLNGSLVEIERSLTNGDRIDLGRVVFEVWIESADGRSRFHAPSG